MSGVMARVMIISLMIYLAITVFMYGTVRAYFVGSETAQTTNRVLGISTADGNVSIDTNALVYSIPQPDTGSITSELSFMATVLAVKDTFTKIATVALTPALLLAMPNSVIPVAIKLFVLLPINLMVFISVIAFIRGYTL